MELFSGRRGRRIYIKYILILGILLFFCLQLDHFARGRAQKEAETDRVPTVELAGYLQVIPLTPEETRTLLLPELGEYLTGKDIYTILTFLRLDELSEEISREKLFAQTEVLSRGVWCGIYERMLEELGLSGQVQTVPIQYLGMLLDEGRLMADNGNYDCDPESIDFVYGETYQVYIDGRLLLGKAAAVPEKNAQEQGEKQEQTQEQGAQTGQIQLPETVRVLLTQDHGENPLREEVFLVGDGGVKVSASGMEQPEQSPQGQAVNCGAWMDEKGVNEMTAEAVNGRLSLADSSGKAVSSAYRGVFRIYRNDSGLWVVNELSMEEYLCGVVPGEMPESFSMEALKAQAVCARTYAAKLVSGKKYEDYQADLNDTTDCQVYLPSGENEKAETAVMETAGKVLTWEGGLADIYYFSTSGGYTSGMEVWQVESPAYLKTVSLLLSEEVKLGENITADAFFRKTDVSAYDSESRYFRWTVKLDLSSALSEVMQVIQNEIEKGSGKVGIETEGDGIASVDQLGGFQSMTVNARNASGTVTDLSLQFEKGNVHLYHENTIRNVLGKAMTAVTDKNGETVHTLTMLPSASFSVEDSGGGAVTLYGGGLGHGIGLSQYGADGMAKAGKEYEEILALFFTETELSGKD